MISPAKATKVAISSLSLFFKIWVIKVIIKPTAPILKIIPIITFDEKGKVHVMEKKRGFKNATKDLVNYVNEHCDKNYPIVPSYTYKTDNLENMISMLNGTEKALPLIKREDVLDYYNNIFDAKNILVSVNGNLSDEQRKDLMNFLIN